jgi:hypothetical protein
MDYFRLAMIVILLSVAGYVLWKALAKPWLESLDEVDEMEELRRDALHDGQGENQQEQRHKEKSAAPLARRKMPPGITHRAARVLESLGFLRASESRTKVLLS